MTIELFEKPDGDKEFTLTMRSLDDESLVAMDEWVRSRAMKTALSSIDSFAPGPARQSYIDQAIRTASSFTWMSGEGAKIMGSIEGVAKMMHESVKQDHPDLTIDRVRRMFFDSRNITRFNAHFKRLNSMRSGDGAQKKPESPPSSRVDHTIAPPSTGHSPDATSGTAG